MINYIRYILDGKTYSLENNGDGTWSKTENAPSIYGNYAVTFEINENGIITRLDSSDPRYSTYLRVAENTERRVFLQSYLPDILGNEKSFAKMLDTENLEFDEVISSNIKINNDMFIYTASHDAILRLENFLGIKGHGTLLQRKNYLVSLMRKGKNLDEQKIKEISNTITGSDCIVKFYGADEVSNPDLGQGLLRVQILSPDGRDYRYEDIERALKPLVPAHLKLVVIKYFSLWKDISVNFSDWNSVKSFSSWGALKNYIPPM